MSKTDGLFVLTLMAAYLAAMLVLSVMVAAGAMSYASAAITAPMLMIGVLLAMAVWGIVKTARGTWL